MKLKMGMFCFLFAAGFLLSGCYYDKSELVYPPDSAACDTTNVTYSGKVLPIITSNCYSCHSGAATNGSGIKLDSYTAVYNQAVSGTLLAVIEHRSGYPAMPKDANKLSGCNIAHIRTWIRNGALNN